MEETINVVKAIFNKYLKDSSHGNPIMFENDMDSLLLEVYKDDKNPAYGSFFYIFNGELKSFKSLSSMCKNVVRLVDKYNLEHVEMETVC